jgi:acyl dehydratase
MTDRLFLDDLHVGQRFTSTSHVVDADQIKRFAAEFDPQPFHLDEDAAANSLFAGLAASGWHTAALTMRLLVMGGVPFCRWHCWRGCGDRLSETDAAR